MEIIHWGKSWGFSPQGRGGGERLCPLRAAGALHFPEAAHQFGTHTSPPRPALGDAWGQGRAWAARKERCSANAEVAHLWDVP